eukprot:PhF_6_TR3211/c0_g2_i1/m.4592
MGCCSSTPHVVPDVKVDVDKLNRELSEDELAAPNVFVTMRSESDSVTTIVKDFGYISASYITRKGGAQARTMKELIEREAEEIESARSHSIAKLRVKAASMGANAVMCLKIEMEQNGRLGITTVIASGSAVVLNPPPEVRNLPGAKPGS